MNTRKIDILYRIVPGIMFLILTLGYFIDSAGSGLSLSRLVFIVSFLIVSVASFIRRDSLPGLILLCLGLAVHTCRNAMRLLDLLSAQQPVLLVVSVLFALGFGLMLVLCLAYSSGTGAALAGVWFLPAALMIAGFLLLQLSQGLSTSFWNFLYPIVSAAGLLLLGVNASDPYFEEEEEEADAPAPVTPRKPVPTPSYTAVGTAAPAQKPAAPAKKAAAPIPAPAAKPAAAPIKTAPLAPAAMEDLKLYKELLDLGVITQAEFEEKKKALACQ